MVDDSRTVALIGPGRAGTTLGLALVDLGWRVVAVVGRAPDAASTNAAVACLATTAKLVSDVGKGAEVVLIATPDRAIEAAAVAAAPSLERGALVVHVAGSRGLDVFDQLLALRPDVRVAAMHPLQSFPSTSAGLDRLPGSWAAIAGDPEVVTLAEELGLRPFVVSDSERTRYHAAAAVAANHVVALMGQVERLAASCGVPVEAFGPLVRASVDNALRLGSAEALTGPVERGDLGTVEAHLRAIDPVERDAYRALAREAARLTGRRDTALDRLLGDLRQPGRPAAGELRSRLFHVDTIAELRDRCGAARAAGGRVGLVPTMGYLHAGHLSLVAAARAATDFVVLTIFVNPLQFGPNEDLDRYPRDLANDLRLCEESGVDCVFTPSVAEMYPTPPLTTVHVADLTAELCGAARPTHFDGVTTVVAKLFSIVGPCRAYFGRKDAEQLAVVRRMATDLNLPVEVIGSPLVREADGLARSSRNAYLTPDQRRAAPVLSRVLGAAADAVAAGERDPASVAAVVRDVVATEPLVALEYVEVRDANELRPLERLDGEVLVALAAHLGTTRLIDNVGLVVKGEEVVADRGVLLAE